MLNIAFWNVHGLPDHKLDDDFFSSLCCKYDIVGLTETMKQDSPRNLPGYSSPFVISSKKLKKRGRNSGGILIYVKPHIRKGLTQVKQTNFSIWFKLDNKTLGLQRTFYLCFCYITPYQKKETSEQSFSKLENEIAFFKCKGDILLCGDLNARTGGMKDFLPSDNIRDTFTDCPLPPNYTPDSHLHRNQLRFKI